MEITMNKEYYMKLIADTFAKFRPRIENASLRKGFDPVFKLPIPSQHDIIRQRDTVLQQIITEAKCLGVKIDFNDPDEYVSPWDNPK